MIGQIHFGGSQSQGATRDGILQQLQVEFTIRGTGREEVGQTVDVGIVFRELDASFGNGSVEEVSATHLTAGGKVGMFGTPPLGLKQPRSVKP